MVYVSTKREKFLKKNLVIHLELQVHHQKKITKISRCDKKMKIIIHDRFVYDLSNMAYSRETQKTLYNDIESPKKHFIVPRLDSHLILINDLLISRICRIRMSLLSFHFLVLEIDRFDPIMDAALGLLAPLGLLDMGRACSISLGAKATDELLYL